MEFKTKVSATFTDGAYRMNEEYVIDPTEIELVKAFLLFIRGRERGIFTAEIISGSGKRAVMISYTEKDKIELNPISTQN